MDKVNNDRLFNVPRFLHAERTAEHILVDSRDCQTIIRVIVLLLPGEGEASLRVG